MTTQFLYTKKEAKRGQAVLITVFLFLFISLVVVLGVTNPILRQAKITKDFISARKSYVLAEAGVEDVLYRLKNNVTVSSVETLTLDGSTVNTTITTTSDGKTITSDASVNNADRIVEAKVATGSGISFNYGILVGNGGFSIAGGSVVNGNVYSNGNISGDGGARITGTAVAANSSPLTADQVNNSPATPPNSITFRNASASQDLAQSFTAATTGPAYKASLYIKKQGNPSDATVRLIADSGGVPGTYNLFTTQATLSASLVTTSYGWVDVVFPTNPQLTSGTTYWIVVDDSSQNSNNYYVIGANSAYSGGAAKVGQYNGTWNNTSPTGLDAYFQIYVGGIVSVITGDGYDYLNVGTGAIGDAWAHTVNSVSAANKVYCQTGTNNNGKTCDTSRGDPPAETFPISDANVAAWKTEAAAGTVYNGNISIGYAGTTTGPTKINGNLTINGGGTMTLTGTLWVTGTVTISNGAGVRLSASYGTGSGVIITDSYVTISGGGTFTGSGNPKSYPMIVSTSDCPQNPSCNGNNAISLSGGAGAVVLYSQNGTLYLSGGTSAKSLSGYKVSLDNGASVTYDSGLANQNFTSGPSGGWDISSWNEI